MWAFCRSKDSVKAISDVIETTHFQKFVRHANDIKLFDSGHVQNCPFLSMPLHFRNACAPLLLFGIALCTCWLITYTLCENNDGKLYARRCCRGIYFRFLWQIFRDIRHSRNTDINNYVSSSYIMGIIDGNCRHLLDLTRNSCDKMQPWDFGEVL
jgi:hypothetical protein